LAKQLETKYAVTSRVTSVNGMHKLQLGPIQQIHLTNKLLDRVQADGYPQSFIVP